MSLRRLQVGIGLLVLLLAGVGAASAEDGRRIALVIGNSTYIATTSLPNAAPDASIFAAFLKQNGFQVDLLVNVSRADFAKALASFSRKITPDDTALFYYAGHGMQLKGENFLLGLDAQLQSEFDVDAETISLNTVIQTMERKAGLSLLFIDACRDNPLADYLNVAVEGATRGSGLKGLAPVDTTGSGTMIAFSASPGQVAYDGGSENSPFATALVRNLATPGLEVGTAFKRVIRDVRLQTNNLQSPQIVSNIADEFYFGPAQREQVAATAPAGTPDAPASEVLTQIDFEKAGRISTARGWELFLAKHQTGPLSDSARAELALLQNDAREVLSPQEEEDRLKLTVRQRKEVQRKLLDLGYGAGPADGMINTRTRRAIVRYQRALGLSETGYLNRVIAKRLELVGVLGTESVVSASEARRFDPDDLKGLESDERIVHAAQCLRGKEIIYGEYGGHLYVAVWSIGVTQTVAAAIAERCKTHLAAIATRAENDFIHKLFAADRRMCLLGYDLKTKTSWKIGPWIGLVQNPGGREPNGGWGWVTGEGVTFSAWDPGAPKEFEDGDDWATYSTAKRGHVDMSKMDVRTWHDMGARDWTNSLVLEFD